MHGTYGAVWQRLAGMLLQIPVALDGSNVMFFCYASCYVCSPLRLYIPEMPYTVMLCSESRPKDIKRIAALERSLSEVQAQLASVEARYQRLRQEMLLR